MKPVFFSSPAGRVLALAALLGTGTVQAADTEDDVLTSATALDSFASYSGGATTQTSDVTFTNGTYANTTFTLNSANLYVGTLNDLDATQALTIIGSERIGLFSAVDSVPGSDAGDLLYVASGANLTVSNTGGIGLGTSGSFDIAGTATINSAIIGQSALTKTGAGTLTLSGANSYTGGTTVSAGTLEATNSGALPGYNTAGKVGVDSGATLAVAVGGSGQWTAANLDSLLGAASFSSGSALGINTTGTGTSGFTYASGITGGQGLTKLGSNTLTLTGASTYTGDTNVKAGTLAVVSGGSVTGGNVSVGTGATLAISGTGSVKAASNDLFIVEGTTANPASVTLADMGSLSTGTSYIGDNGPGTFTQSGGTFTTNGNLFGLGLDDQGSYSLSGTGILITGAAVIGYNGPGTFTQTGGSFTTNGNKFSLGLRTGSSSSASTYNLSGTGNLSTGEADIGADDSGTLGTFTQSGGTFTTNGQQLIVSSFGSSYSLSGTGRLSTGLASIGGTFTQSGGTFTTNGQALSLADDGDGTYTLSGGVLTVGSVSHGQFDFNGGTLQAGASSTNFFSELQTADVQAGGAKIDTQSYNVTIAQALTSGTAAGTPDGGLTKTGGGTLMLTGANTFTGPLNINAGTLAVASESNLGAETDTLTVGGGGELLFTGSATLSRTYDLGISKLGAVSGSTLTFSGATVNGGFLAGPGTDALGDGASLNAVTTLAASTLTQTGGTATLNTSTIRGTLTQSAGATLNLADSTVTSAGTLNVSGTVNTSGVEIDGVTTINSGGTVANSGGSLILGPGSRTTINAGVTAAANGMLSATSDTSIELNDALLVNNGTQSGTLNVNYGSTLKGSGTFGTVNVTAGGKFSPGNSPGTATVSSLNLQSAGNYQFELNSATAANNDPGDDADLIHVDNTLTISAGTTTNSRFTVAVVSLDANDNPAALSDFDPSRSYRFVLATSTGISGFNAAEFAVDTSGFANNLAGGSFSVVQDGNNLDLIFTSVPEPGTWALLGVGAGSALLMGNGV